MTKPTCQYFSWVPVPTGPQPLPDWVAGAHVDWGYGYGNSPTMHVKCRYNAHKFEGWEYRNGLYFAIHQDGRCKALSHGPLAMRTLRRYAGRKDDGTAIYEEYQALATQESEGFAGRNFEIEMKDGRKAILRGPWFGAAPAGFVQITTHEPHQHRPYHKNGPWWDTLGCFGLFISQDLWLRILARYEPTCKAAMVTRYYGTSLDPVRWDWAVPKCFLPRSTQHRLGKPDLDLAA